MPASLWPGLPGAISFAGLPDAVAAALERTSWRAFVLCAGCRWSLPVYELAISAAEGVARPRSDAAAHRGHSPAGPAVVLGPDASAAIADLLADRVVALPRLSGPAVPGFRKTRTASSRSTGHGHVPGLPGVYAAGDATTSCSSRAASPQQADAAAESIAAHQRVTGGGRAARRAAKPGLR